jgi:hypothetical protein
MSGQIDNCDTVKRPVGGGSADRMRALRERRRHGLRCVTVELYDREITALVRRGLLLAREAGDRNAIRTALHRLLERVL